MLRICLVEVVNEAGVARRRAVRRRAWCHRIPDSSRVNEYCRRSMPANRLSAESFRAGGSRAAAEWRASVGEESEVADAHETGRQQMEQKAAQELIDSQSHEPLLVAVRGISPAEGDLAIGESDQPGVRDGDAMSVCAEIAQHMLRSAEGRLGIDDPVVAEQYPQPGRESARLGQRQQAAVELEFTSMESVAKSGDELAAEDAAEHADGKKEGTPGGDPA